MSIFTKYFMCITILLSTSYFLAGCATGTIILLASATASDNSSDTSETPGAKDIVEQVELRSSSMSLSVKKVQKISRTRIHKKKKCGFYGHSTIKHNYVLKAIDNDKVVIDHTTSLMWHQSGSTHGMNWENAHRLDRETDYKRICRTS